MFSQMHSMLIPLYYYYIMGCTDSNQEVFNKQGQPIMNRKCLVFVAPPSFQTSKFIEQKPQMLKYRFISVGKLIRDEINKRTHYSKIIMENLAKNKKINDKILEILLKNVSLQGNFIIQFCPKDHEDLLIWKKFLSQVDVQLVIIINQTYRADDSHQKQLYQQKLKNYQNQIKNIRNMFKHDKIAELQYDEQTWQTIIMTLNAKQKKNHKTPVQE